MSQFIKPLPHVSVEPVSVVREHPDVLVIEGVRYAGDFFRQNAYPETDVLYSIRRDGDQVWMTVIHNAEQAQKFFVEIGQEPPVPAEDENVL